MRAGLSRDLKLRCPRVGETYGTVPGWTKSYAPARQPYAGGRLVDQNASCEWALMTTQHNFPLSTSEKLTLRYIAEGELHPRELDWLAIQRLKQAGLLQARPQGFKMTDEGRRALQRVLAGS